MGWKKTIVISSIIASVIGGGLIFKANSFNTDYKNFTRQAAAECMQIQKVTSLEEAALELEDAQKALTEYSPVFAVDDHIPSAQESIGHLEQALAYLKEAQDYNSLAHYAKSQNIPSLEKRIIDAKGLLRQHYGKDIDEKVSKEYAEQINMILQDTIKEIECSIKTLPLDVAKKMEDYKGRMLFFKKTGGFLKETGSQLLYHYGYLLDSIVEDKEEFDDLFGEIKD